MKKGFHNYTFFKIFLPEQSSKYKVNEKAKVIDMEDICIEFSNKYQIFRDHCGTHHSVEKVEERGRGYLRETN